MWDSKDTTGMNTVDYNSQLSFYEYPSHKPFINSNYQPLRPSNSLSKKVTLPESNRDQLLTALQSLSLRIKNLENERERAETNLRELTSNVHRPRPYQANLQDEFDLINQERPRKTRSSRKKKRSCQPNGSFETETTNHPDGRHYHLDMNAVPFILGASTSPSHNVKSNLQNVIALLKNHNNQLCLSSKEYGEIHPHIKGDLSPHTLLYLDHYNKSSLSNRPSSASPVRAVRRQTNNSNRRPRSASRRPQSANFSDKQCYSRIKHLRQEFGVLAREHARLNTSRSNTRELDIINRRMEIILEELEYLQKLLRNSIRKSSSREQIQFDKAETPLQTLRKTRLLQFILKDSTNTQQYKPYSH